MDRRSDYDARMDRRAGCPFGGDESCGGCRGDCWTDAEHEREPEQPEPRCPHVGRDDEHCPCVDPGNENGPPHWSDGHEALAAHRARGW